MYIFTNTILLTMELNQKVTKSIPRRCSIEKRTWKLKKGEGICSKGGLFSVSVELHACGKKLFVDPTRM